MTLIALTGASGFLGGHLAEVLVDRGHTVRGVVRNPDKAAWLGARGVALARADLADVEALTAAFVGADAVVANAGLSTPDPTEHAAFVAANIAGVENTMRAASAAGVTRVVMISSVSVHRLTRPFGRYDLDTPLLDEGARWSASRITTNWSYARTKAAGERRARELAAELGLRVTYIRPGPIYGPRDHKLTARWARQMQRAIVFAPTVGVPHVHAADVAGAVAGALANEAAIGQAYFTTGDPVSPYRILSIWREIAGRGPTIVPIPVPLSLSFDDGPAIADLGFVSRDIASGVRDVVQFLG